MDKKNATPKSSANSQRHYSELLDRFEAIKKTGENRWIARCPAHADRGPSLSIKDTGDRLLTHCFAGCTFREIADAIGALPREFFADGYDRRQFDQKHRVPWRDIVEVIRGEAWVVLQAAAQLRAGDLKAADQTRLIEAARRIEQAWRAGNV